MMPFSPLRTWGLGLFGWALLAAGVYCLWVWADQAKPVVVLPADVREPVETQRVTREGYRAETGRDWRLLAAGIVLLTLSGAGFLPVTLLFGRPGFAAPIAEPGHTITVERPDGTRLHVEVHGPKLGPTLVFTHGWSLDSSCWRYQLPALGDRFRVVVWDLPGLGRSKGPKNGDYSLDKMAQDLEAVVQVAGKGPIVLVGHSIGGMITQSFCRLYPKQLGPRVAGIVLLHTTYTNPLRTALFARFWTAIERPVLIPLNHVTIWLAPLAWLSNVQSYLNGSLHVMTRIASFAGRQTWGQLHHGAWLAAKAWPGVVARGNLAMLDFDEQATLPSIDIPVLVIGAENDRMTKVSASERIEAALPQGAITRVAAGHLGFWEQYAKVNELIAEFAEHFAESRSTTLPIQRPHTLKGRAGKGLAP